MDGYRELVNAIVLQTVKDWRSAVKVLRKRPRYEPAITLKTDCESFFRSGWFETLTEADGCVILRKLKQEEHIDDE